MNFRSKITYLYDDKIFFTYRWVTKNSLTYHTGFKNYVTKSQFLKARGKLILILTFEFSRQNSVLDFHGAFSFWARKFKYLKKLAMETKHIFWANIPSLKYIF